MLFGDFLVGYFTLLNIAPPGILVLMETLEDELYVVINAYKFTAFDCYHILYVCTIPADRVYKQLIVLHVHLCHQSVHVAMGRL